MSAKDSKNKKKKSKKIDKKTKADIKKAVDSIPGLIVEQVKFEKETKNKPEEKISYLYDEKAYNKKKHLMWFGVITIALVIFVMWAWNAKTLFGDIGQMKKNNPSPWEATKGSFGEIMDSLSNDESNDLQKALDEKKEQDIQNTDEINIETEEDLKQDIKKSLLNIITNTTSTTSTE